MAYTDVTKLTADVENVSRLATYPTCTVNELKATFDKAGKDIKAYINDTLCEKVDEIGEAVDAIEAGTVSSLDASAITSGTINAARLPSSGINGNAITTGTVGASYIAPLPASKINDGTLSIERIPTIPLTKGGTGASTADGARSAIGAAAASHTHSFSDISGTASADQLPAIGAAKYKASYGTADPSGTGELGQLYFKVI